MHEIGGTSAGDLNPGTGLPQLKVGGEEGGVGGWVVSHGKVGSDPLRVCKFLDKDPLS